MSAEITISNLLIKLLPEHKEVSVPGLGTFDLKHVNQYLSDAGGILLPSISKIAITDKIDSKKDVIKLGVEKGYVGDKEVKKLTRSLQKQVNTFLNLQRLELPGIGMLSRNSSGKMILDSSGNYFNRGNLLLPEIEVTPSPPSTQVDAEIPVDEGKEVIHHNIAFDSTSISKEPSNVQPDWIQLYLFPSIFGIILALILLLVIKQLQGQDTYDPVMIGMTPSIQTPQVDPIVESRIFSHETLEKYGAQPVAEKQEKKESCIVITGSFKTSSAAERMMARILEYSLEAYSGRHNGLTRVGVKFDCEMEELDDFIEKIKRDISSEAWILE